MTNVEDLQHPYLTPLHDEIGSCTVVVINVIVVVIEKPTLSTIGSRGSEAVGVGYI